MKGETILKIGMFLLVAGVLLSVIPFVPQGTHYKGTVVFQTEEEYTQFKQDVAVAGVNLKQIQILASDPPVIAQLDVYLPSTASFQYGTPSTWYAPFPFAHWLILISVVAILGGATLMVRES